MSLSDIVGSAGLAAWAEVALLLFAGVFVAIAVRVLLRSERDYDHQRRLPLEEGVEDHCQGDA